jgi:hypothetical protein
MSRTLSRSITLLGVGAAAAGLVATGVSTAGAATTFTVKAGSAAVGSTVKVTGATTGTTPQIKLTDVTSGTVATCDSGTGSGTVKPGTYAPSATIATLTGSALKPVNCVGPLGLKLSTFAGIGTWSLKASSYKSGVTTGTLSGVKANIAATGGTCSFTGAGSVSGTFTNSTQSLKTSSTKATLTVSNVVGCFGLIANGDKASIALTIKLKATTTADNPITVTSP